MIVSPAARVRSVETAQIIDECIERSAEIVVEKVRSLGRQAKVALATLDDPDSHAQLVETAWAWRGVSS